MGINKDPDDRPPDTTSPPTRLDRVGEALRGELSDVVQFVSGSFSIVASVAAIILTLWAFVRLVVLAGFDQTIMLEIVRRQDLGGVGVALIVSTLQPLAILSVAAMLLFGLFVLTPAYQGAMKHPLLLGWSLIIMSAIFAAAFLPVWLWASALALLFAFFLRPNHAHRIAAVAAAAVAAHLIFQLLTASWLPREQLVRTNPAAVTSGWVIGEAGDFTSFLESPMRRVRAIHLIRTDEISSRQLCAPTLFRQPGPALIVDALYRLSRPPAAWLFRSTTKPCMNNPADLPVQPGAIILCIARDTAIVRIGATKEECAADGSEPIVVMQQGPTGKTGEKGEKGDQGDPGLNGADGTNGTNGTNGIDGKDGTNGKDGQPGKDGIDGKPGQPGKDGTNGEDGRDGSPQVWAVVNASGKVVDSSTKVKVRRPTDSAGRYVVKTNAVKLPDCGVAVQSMRLGSDGPRKFLVSTKSRSTGPRLSSGEILVEAFQHGQRRDGGFALVATCDKKK